MSCPPSDTMMVGENSTTKSDSSEPHMNRNKSDTECTETTSSATSRATGDKTDISQDTDHLGIGDTVNTNEVKDSDSQEDTKTDHSQGTDDEFNVDSAGNNNADLSRTECDETEKDKDEQSAGNADSGVKSDEGTDEARLESCSEDSGSEDEYESADEGEEIHVDAENLREMEETLTDEDKEERRLAAQTLKEEGNTLFRSGTYKTAIRTYSRALRTCPLKFAKDRAIMYSNRAACKMKLDEVEEAVRDCTKALDLHPHYLKARMRRAELYEKLEKLDEALADFQKIVEQDPSQHAARAACMRLPPLIEQRNEKMKEEMMSKLKDLGNMVLRPFGLSTNNFQLNKDPNSGGYSVNFVQKPDSES